MKTRTILGIAAAALFFSSCSKNETDGRGPVMPNDPSRIGFGINTGSRGVDLGIGDLEKTEGFTVAAVKAGSGTPVAYFHEIYKYKSGVWDWNNEEVADQPKFEWPAVGAENYPITFYSFYAKGAENSTPVYEAPNKTVSIAIAPLVENQLDYLAAHAEVAAAPDNGRTSFVFKHILSKILFNIQATTDVKVNIQSIKIVNVQDETSRVTAPVYNPFLLTGWVNPIVNASDKAPAVYVDYAYRLAAEDAKVPQNITGATAVAVTNGTKGALLLMPQYGTPAWDSKAFSAKAKELIDNGTAIADQPAWETAITAENWAGARVEVVYNMTKANGTDYTVGAANKFIRVGYVLDMTDLAKAWAAGTQYTYTIELGTKTASGGILLDPFYKDENGDSTTEPINNPSTVKPGDPISTGNRIGFAVSVGDWTPSAKPIK